MERIKIYDKTPVINPKDECELQKSADSLRNGEVVAFPTETVYGLGANAFNQEAVERIFKAKGRPSDNPLIVHISDKSQIDELVSEITPMAQKLIDNFMPGPITVIMRKSKLIPDNVTAGLDTVGVRMPNHKVGRCFLSLCNCPVAAPSANLSGSPSPTKAKHVMDDMDGYINSVIDGGEADYGLESTVVDATGEVPVILRPGAVTKSQIDRVLGLDIEDNNVLKEGQKARAPGMKYRHYAPKARVEIINLPSNIILINDEVDTSNLLESGNVNCNMPDIDLTLLNDEDKHRFFDAAYLFISKIKELIKANPLTRIGVYCGVEIRSIINKMDDNIVKMHTEFFCYGHVGDVLGAAHYLFDGLRQLDVNQVDVILATGFGSDGVSRAYMNRLQKAVGKMGELPDSIKEGDSCLARSKLSLESFNSTATANILFVCQKNNLSVIAETLMRKLLEKEAPYCLNTDDNCGVELYVESCGFDAMDGENLDCNIVNAIKEVSQTDVSYKTKTRADVFTYDNADLIICMRDDALKELLDRFPQLKDKCFSLSSFLAYCGLVFKNTKGEVVSLSIPDPSGENYETFVHTVKLIKAYLEVLLPYIIKEMGIKRI